jgi:hypothetical protein
MEMNEKQIQATLKIANMNAKIIKWIESELQQQIKGF